MSELKKLRLKEILANHKPFVQSRLDSVANVATGVVVENGDQIILSVSAEPASTVVTVPIKSASEGYEVSANRASVTESTTVVLGLVTVAALIT